MLKARHHRIHLSGRDPYQPAVLSRQPLRCVLGAERAHSVLHLLADPSWRAHCPSGVGAGNAPGAGRNRCLREGLSPVIQQQPQQGLFHNEKVGLRHPG